MSHPRETLSREPTYQDYPWDRVVDTADDGEHGHAESGGHGDPFRSLTRLLALSSFLLAIVLPVVYLPILIAGFPTPAYIPVTAGLIVLHIASLILGHNYLPRVSGEPANG